MVINKDGHRINFMLGDSLVLVDSKPQYLKHPVDLYQGMIVVPLKFKEQVLDVLFSVKPTTAGLRKAPLNLKKIVIDPGHGGYDPGAVGKSGLREKDINLDIAKRLSNLFRSEGVEVVMVRSTDMFVPLSSRVEIANRAKADLFLSIHTNANRVRGLNGFEVYYISSTADNSRRAVQSAQNAALDFDSSCFASNSLDLKATLWDMVYTYDRAESIRLARSICQNMERGLEVKILGIKGAGFYVLKGARMPAVLVEVGFLSNSSEERMLRNSYYRQKIAEGIFEGVRSYSQEFVFRGL
ncbi:N-acetylmuramoyl-L-alanine amidase [bacterium]|nr:MAG: N-acetylmuramoyl-L-alanine amidase [bacterium]